uniref:C-type lectin domain-containing protein n=1 Tax=Oreochromis aureus TaxID=47969 RepID=A0A668RV76_OREAU
MGKWIVSPDILFLCLSHVCILGQCCFFTCQMKKDNKTLYLIKDQKLNWTEAQNYCRYNYTDLASGLDQVDGKEYEDRIKGLTSPFSIWFGLFRDTWRWSDGSNFSFRYWDIQLFNDKQSNKTCAMTLLNRSGKWSSDECDHCCNFSLDK